MIHIKHMLVLIIFLLQGCSWNPFVSENELNTVNVVKHLPYLKYYRAYFEREHLHKFPNKKKYIYLFNKKKHILGLLLHRKNDYFIYNLSQANNAPIELSAKGKVPYKSVRKAYKKEGFYRIRSPKSIGFLIFVSLRQYKKTKTLRFNIKNYSKLQNIYKHAIKSYQIDAIPNIKTRLPKQLIYNYYLHYKKLVKTEEEKKAIIKIGSKLHLLTKNLKVIPKKSKKNPPKRKESSALHTKNHPKKEKAAQEDFPEEEIQEDFPEEEIQEDFPEEEIQEDFSEEEVQDKENLEYFQEEEIQKDIYNKNIQTAHPPKEKSIYYNKTIQEKNITKKKTYIYYLKQATLKELKTYLSESSTINTLSYTQYNALTQRRKNLREEEILRTGTLSELLLAYKLTKDEKYKERIMFIMKNKHGSTTAP